MAWQRCLVSKQLAWWTWTSRADAGSESKFEVVGRMLSRTGIEVVDGEEVVRLRRKACYGRK
jgi:hypothetical protein